MDLKKAFDERKKEFRDLQQRIDDDADLVNLKEYVLKDVNDKNVPRAISVTLNDPAVFAANVESSLSNAIEQINVESENKKLDTAYVEDIVKAAFDSADFRRQKQGEFPLNPILDQMMCRRGGAAARCLFREENGVIIPDIVPWDRRYFYYSMGSEGLSWAGYEVERDKDDIESEAWAIEKKFTLSGKSATVLDLWDSEVNEIYVKGSKVFEQANPYGFVPVCFQLVPMGNMLHDKDYLKYQGESIFFLIRDLIPELNRLVSIIQSLNMKELDHALLWRSEGGATVTPPKYADLDTPGSVTATDEKGGVEPVNFGQLKQQAWLLHQMIETRTQRGSLSNFDYGTFSQPMSAVALVQVGEGRDQVFLPRLGTRGFLKQQLAYMILEQISGLGSVELGVRGHKQTFDVSKLEGEFNLEFKYFVKSPTIDIARYETASAAIGTRLTSRKTARREIIQLEDPDREERLLDAEEIEELVPAIKLRRKIKSLYEMADRGDEEARLDAELAEETLKMMIGQAGEAETRGREPSQLLSLMGKETAAKPTSGQEAANLKRTPVEEE